MSSRGISSPDVLLCTGDVPTSEGMCNGDVPRSETEEAMDKEGAKAEAAAEASVGDISENNRLSCWNKSGERGSGMRLRNKIK
jgi:hypothetical protein